MMKEQKRIANQMETHGIKLDIVIFQQKMPRLTKSELFNENRSLLNRFSTQTQANGCENRLALLKKYGRQINIIACHLFISDNGSAWMLCTLCIMYPVAIEFTGRPRCLTKTITAIWKSRKGFFTLISNFSTEVPQTRRWLPTPPTRTSSFRTLLQPWLRWEISNLLRGPVDRSGKIAVSLTSYATDNHLYFITVPWSLA